MIYLFIFIIWCPIYVTLEVIWSALIYQMKQYKYSSFMGYTSLWMIPIGGYVGIITHLINLFFASIFIKMIMFMILITILEYISGLLLNAIFDLNLWDYSNSKFNIDGQICIQYSLLWFLLAYPALWFDNILRNILVF